MLKRYIFFCPPHFLSLYIFFCSSRLKKVTKPVGDVGGAGGGGEERRFVRGSDSLHAEMIYAKSSGSGSVYLWKRRS